jgi:hypothetical protein
MDVWGMCTSIPRSSSGSEHQAGGEKKGVGRRTKDEDEDVRASKRASDGSASNADHGARDAASERCDTTAVRALTTTGSL